MKRSIYTIVLIALALFGCKKDNNIVAVKSDNPGSPAIKLPADASTISVTQTNMDDKVVIRWAQADYGVKTELSYTVQVDKAGNNFAAPVALGTTTSDSLSTTKANINSTVLNTLSLPANAESEIEIRVRTVFNKDSVISKPIKIKVMTYKDIIPERLKLNVPGAYQDWKPELAVAIYNTEGSKYEGYVYMATAGEFKFTSAPDWNHINYGFASDGKLTTDGLKGGIVVAAPGYYKFNVDVNALTYSYKLVDSFGIIGSATSGGWDNSTPMVYSAATGLWKVTANLVEGAVKFRANNNWDLNYGPASSAQFSGKLIQTNDAVNISSAGSYTITIDMRQNTPDSYTYTIVKN
ncbi:hypothetical protein GCM10023149_07590 [Mucilaginibacter gynuensis]|uniref:SusE outer membrane protein domain-containing protein n=1 Tax=Mucilaginibacter gynuensis TaxID=1302236 RepID=A0ABP8FW82_9SPHI